MKKLPKFRIMTDAVFGKNQRFSFSIEVGLFDYVYVSHHFLPSIRSRKLLIISAILTPKIFLKEMTPGDQLGTLRVGQQLLEARRERLVIKPSSSRPQTSNVGNFDFLSPRSSQANRSKARAVSSNGIQRGQVQVEQPRGGIGQDALVNVLRFVAKFLFCPRPKGTFRGRPGRCVSKQIRAEKRRVHYAPWKYAFVEFSRRERPSPSAHNHERSDAESEFESAKPKPVGPPNRGKPWSRRGYRVAAAGRSGLRCGHRGLRLCSRTGFSDRPKPIMLGTMTRRPPAVSGFTNFRYKSQAGLPCNQTGSPLPSST